MKQGSEIGRSEPLKCYLNYIGNNFPINKPNFIGFVFSVTG